MLVQYYWRVNNNGIVSEDTNLSYEDRIRMSEYEISYKKERVQIAKDKLEIAEKNLAKELEKYDELKDQAKDYIAEEEKRVKEYLKNLKKKYSDK